jgi:hypothetical protein
VKGKRISMTKKCSRDPVLTYLSKFDVKNNENLLKKHIVGWCYENQGDLGRKAVTYLHRVNIMTIDTGKWKNQRHPDGLDDIFVRVDVDYVRLFDPNKDHLP